jgi:hypothetical protein
MQHSRSLHSHCVDLTGAWPSCRRPSGPAGFGVVVLGCWAARHVPGTVPKHTGKAPGLLGCLRACRVVCLWGMENAWRFSETCRRASGVSGCVSVRCVTPVTRGLLCVAVRRRLHEMPSWLLHLRATAFPLMMNRHGLWSDRCKAGTLYLCLHLVW